MLAEAVVFLRFFEDLPDPRQRAKVVYALDEIVLLCLLAVLAGAETITDMARFGEKKRAFLRRFRLRGRHADARSPGRHPGRARRRRVPAPPGSMPRSGASWINQVERFFALLTERRIRRGVHRSVADLEAAIAAFLSAHNAKPKPFRDEPDRIVGADVIVHCLRQQQHLRAVGTRQVRHGKIYHPASHHGILSRVLTQSA